MYHKLADDFRDFTKFLIIIHRTVKASVCVLIVAPKTFLKPFANMINDWKCYRSIRTTINVNNFEVNLDL